MRRCNKLLALLMSLIMVLSLVPVVGAEEAAPLATENDIVIYYTNDVHTYIDSDLGYDNIAALKDETAALAAGVLLVDAGDHVQGTAYGSMDKGATIVELMNAAGYDLATLGNHEFDYGMDGAMNVIDWAEYPYVSANFYHEKDGVVGETVLDAYKVFEIGGKKIAIVGLTTPETFTKSTPAYFQNEKGEYIYGIGGGEDGKALYEMAQKAIDAASAEADIVIALGHLGDDPASQPWTSEELIANTKGLDAFIDGHSHSTAPMKEVKDAEGNTVVLTQTGEYFGAIGKMVIDVETLAIETGLITEYEGSDAEVKAIADAWIAEIDTKLGEVIGYAEVTFDNYDETGRLVRKQETNTGDFAADALYYLFDNMGLDVDVAIMNGGGVRNKTITGELSYKTMKDIHTFGNVACLQTITGQQLLDALEWGARGTTLQEIGGFLHVSGISYEIHVWIPPTVQHDDKDVWTGGPSNGQYRVQNVMFWNEETQSYDIPLDLEAEYNLAGYNYTLRDLGDGFAMFDGAVNVLDYVMEDYMVLANYVKSFPVNETTGLPTITAENSPYASVYGEGRITLYSEIVDGICQHEWSEWEEVVEPSSTEEGAMERRCSICLHIENKAIPKLENPFTDVKQNDYFYEPVLWGSYRQITSGTTATTFSPNAYCTRGQIVTFIWASQGRPDPETTENPFTDVAETDYFYKAVLWAVEEGITTGTSATTFSPNAVCTRAHAVTFLYKLTHKPGQPEAVRPEPNFVDVDIEDYFYKAVKWASDSNVTAGISKTHFGPNAPCTRGQIMTFLYRMFAD